MHIGRTQFSIVSSQDNLICIHFDRGPYLTHSQGVRPCSSILRETIIILGENFIHLIGKVIQKVVRIEKFSFIAFSKNPDTHQENLK